MSQFDPFAFDSSEAEAKFYGAVVEVLSGGYTSVPTQEEAVELLTDWFVTPPSPHLLTSDLAELLEPEGCVELVRVSDVGLQIKAFENALASFEPLIVLSVTESGHILCPEGECVGWVR